MDFRPFIRDIPDFPKPGIQFKDITPLLADPTAFRASVERLAERYGSSPIDAIAAAEARGFLFAAPLALALRKPLVPLRKPGKLPYRTYSLKYDLEYGQAELHMHVDGIIAGQRVLMIDDVLATGGTMAAGCQLVERAGGVIHGCAFLVELAFLNGRQKLTGYDLFSLLTY
jgi:adenine phosphoribosyltransferase